MDRLLQTDDSTRTSWPADCFPMWQSLTASTCEVYAFFFSIFKLFYKMGDFFFFFKPWPYTQSQHFQIFKRTVLI